MQPALVTENPFYDSFRGRFSSLLSWEQLDAFWDTVYARANAGWYLYAVGESVPSTAATAEQVKRFISEIDALLRREHQEDYCGIVYADNVSEPAFIKIFDPHNLGVQCGYSDNPPLPGWVMSRLPPSDLRDQRPLPGNRQRWWQRLWA